MAQQPLNIGHDVVALAFSRTTFNGGASASATSTPISINQYRRVAALLSTTGAATLTASTSLVYNPEVSSDAATWVALSEVNGQTVGTITHTPISTAVTNKGYVYPVAAPWFRIRISGAGAASSGISAAGSVTLQP